jgi:class 3 adenylate cyclase
MTCPSCGARTGDADRFCPGCGTSLRAAEADRETRKRVSILFLDIVGSTALGERLDPEPLRQVMDRYFAVCATSIAEHGGMVEKFIGDAVLAVFGATVAREDDALRAVRAASGSLAALRDLSTELTASYQLSLEARCGICSGDVIVITAPGGSRPPPSRVRSSSARTPPPWSMPRSASSRCRRCG